MTTTGDRSAAPGPGDPPDAPAGVVIRETSRVRVVLCSAPDGTQVIRREVLGPSALAQAEHEAAIIRRLAGVPGVPILLGEPDGAVLSVRYIPGNRLSEQIPGSREGNHGPEGSPGLDLPALLTLGIDLATMLAGIHRRGVIHKEINPRSLMLAVGDRSPFLIDFELAGVVLDEQPSFTHTSAIVGTLAYLAPEQTGRTGQAADHRVDLYSLGATLFELCTGSPPFGHGTDDPLTLIHDQLTRVPALVTVRNPALPPILAEIVAKLLEKEPDRRYQSGEGLAHDLRRVRENPDDFFTLGEHDFPLRLAAPSRLIAREAEIRVLVSAFARAAAGPVGGILVTGPAGVGRSALIDQLRPTVTAGGGWFITGRSEQRQDQGTDAVFQALRGLGRLLLAEPEAALTAHRDRLLTELGDRAPVAALIPEFALLLGVEAQAPAGDPREAQHRMLRAFLDVLRATASPQRPVLMLLDDLQWAPAFPVDLMNAALTADDLHGLLLVGAFRDGELGAGHPLTTMLARWGRLELAPPVLRLENLPTAELAVLLTDMLRLPATGIGELADAVGARTGGNPGETVELLNALRAEGALSLGEAGWTWDLDAIRRHVGEGVAGRALLMTRLDRLPAPTLALLETLACLGGTADRDLLVAATGTPALTLRDWIGPALDDGLVVVDTADEATAGRVGIRHDRVRRAVEDRLDPDRRQELHLRLGRLLATALATGASGTTVAGEAALAAAAAEQYLPVVGRLTDPGERLTVTGLLRRAATRLRLIDPVSAERFLAAAITLLPESSGPPEQALRLRIEHHAVLYALGRFEPADELYRWIERHCPDPLDQVDAGCVQISSLTNRTRMREAVELGFGLLGRLGLRIPSPQGMHARMDQDLDELYRWSRDLGTEADADEVTDPTVLAIGRVVNRMLQPAFFGDQEVLAWLVLESRLLWERHGPIRSLVGALSHAGIAAIDLRQEYRTGYEVVQRILAVGEARDYESETAHARLLFAVCSQPWIDPLDVAAESARQARDGLVQGGDLENAVFSYFASLPLELDTTATLEGYLPTVEAGLRLATRTGNDHALAVMLPYRQFVRALRGETDPAHSFGDGSFDEAGHAGALAGNSTAGVNFHTARALAAAVFGDDAELARRAAAAIALPTHGGGGYVIAKVYLMQALALANAARNAGPQQRTALVEQLDQCRAWLSARSADAPGNFAHLSTWMDAERAWAIGDFASAIAGFDSAMQQSDTRRASWQRALITERAAAFHLAHGHEHAARSMTRVARDAYAAWGASAKVAQMHRRHPFLRAAAEGGTEPGQSGELLRVSSDTVDLVALLRASQALSGETEFDRLRTRVVEVLTSMTGATTVTVLLRDDDEQWVLPGVAGDAALGMEASAAADLLPLSAFRYAERTRTPLLVSDATRDDRFSADPYLAQARVCSLLVVPILSQGVPRVMLVLENRVHDSMFSPDRLDGVLLIAGQLAVSFENALARRRLEREGDRRLRLLATLRQRERLLETLLSIQRDISHRVPLQKVLDAVTAGASAMLDDAFVALVLVDPLGDGRPRIPSVCGVRSRHDEDELVLAVATEAIAADHLVSRPDRADGDTGGLLAAPVHASGEIIGSLVTSGSDDAHAQSDRLELLGAFAEQVSLALNDANTLEAIREASYDSLTGLASRALFLDRLKRALVAGAARESELTVLFIDLNRFKAVNDTLGHAAGDDLLAGVAERLRGCIRENDTGARLGGDEFAVLLEDTHGPAAGVGAAERIGTTLRQPFRIAGQDIFASASIGVAHGAASGQDSATLLEQADLAMYEAKKTGSRRAVVFEPQMRAEAKERLGLQGDFQRALAVAEFRLVFQPLLRLDQGTPLGVEALVRWPHPRKGMISPATFIPLAEETGAIVELGRWVLVESCRQVARWRQSDWPDLELSINVSGRQLLDGQLAADVRDILTETGLPPRALTLELTETVLMDDTGGTLTRLDELKSLGVQLAIDDFGTGYSSLSYLRRFPVDKLKVDKSFIDNIVTDAEDLAIVRTVIELARILHLQTTAEGIETQEQLDLLRELGCVVGQGYLIARPLNPDAVPAYLAGHRDPGGRIPRQADGTSAELSGQHP